ncbi:MAG: alpha/beta fold hydrolase [Candidatus Moraniibacteriota bacterium]
MRKRIIMIHGWGGTAGGDWLPWVKDKLKKKGFDVVVPEMPNTEEPKIEEWVNFLVELIGNVDENTFLIGHSIGCQAIMRYLEKIYPQKFGKIIFVAPWFNLNNLEDAESEEIAKPWIEVPIDLGKVKNSCDDINVLLSDNDLYVPLSDGEIFKEKLNANIIILKNKGHFTGDDDVLEFPEILDLLI